ncbi:uncharacterized protein LOC142321402 isoform X1 [Lycorma delicatula]|uniref:uncharacterized protein LOC142321402 isoform X1 n=1 Tax=Lycorma delicatula TaxID=130591 RepID=UPI003F510BCE
MSTVELSTPDKLEYNYYPVSGGSLHFTVKTPNDAHIALTQGPSETDSMYEIFIGGWNNSKSVIRKNRQKPDKAIQETPNILTADEAKGFWIRWNGGSIALGKKGEAEPFLSWDDPEPFPVTHYGICTGWGASGEWVIEDFLEIHTPDNLEYSYRSILWGRLDVFVNAAHDAHIALTSGPNDTEPMYEIILGGWGNTASVIRYNKEKPDKAKVETPSLLSDGEDKLFVITWLNGLLKIITDGQTLLEWKDPNPFEVTHFGICTGWGAEGKWRVTANGNKFIPLAPKSEPGWNLDNIESTGPAKWTAASGGEIPPNAIPAGIDNEQLYVGRANHEGAILPGKVVPSHGVCYVPWGGAEHGIPEYEVLCGCDATWMPATAGEVPSGALPSGETEDGEILYVGRAQHEGVTSIGKVQGSHKVCYIPFGGQEIAYPEYEVLVAK